MSSGRILPTPAWTAALRNDSWLQPAAGFVSSVGGTNFVFTFAPNPGPTRTGSISVNNQTLTVTQAGSPPVAAGALTPLSFIPVSVGYGGQPHASLWTGSAMFMLPDVSANTIWMWPPGLMRQPAAISASISAEPVRAIQRRRRRDLGDLFLVDLNNGAIEEWNAADATLQEPVQTRRPASFPSGNWRWTFPATFMLPTEPAIRLTHGRR